MSVLRAFIPIFHLRYGIRASVFAVKVDDMSGKDRDAAVERWGLRGAGILISLAEALITYQEAKWRGISEVLELHIFKEQDRRHRDIFGGRVNVFRRTSHGSAV